MQGLRPHSNKRTVSRSLPLPQDLIISLYCVVLLSSSCKVGQTIYWNTNIFMTCADYDWRW